MQKITILFLLTTLFACKNQDNTKAQNATNKTPSLEMCMDTLGSGTSWEFFAKGYRDTCTMNGHFFAVRLRDTTEMAEKNGLLEKKVNGNWIAVDSFHYGQYGYDFKTDYNNDGFRDFIANLKWSDDVFLYDAKKQTFVYTGEFYTGSKDSSICIDASKGLYADRWSYKFENGWSYLYTLKDLKRTNLAKMEYISQDKNGDLIGKISKRTIEVSSLDADNTATQIEILRNPKGFEEYNYPYAEYWKKNWQKFLK